MRRTFRLLAIASAAAFFCIGCAHKPEPAEAPPVRVTTMEIGTENVSPASGSQYSGTVSSSETTIASFSVAGTLTEIRVSEGDRVSKGQVLARIGAGDYENADNIAKAELAEAQDAYERLKKLHDANALPEVKWVEMENKLKQAQNAAAISRRTLGETALTAPVSGTVSRRIADLGQYVVPAEPILEIVAVDRLTIDVPVPEQEIGNFREGQKASVSFPALGLDGIEGRVTQKSITADPLTRSYTVKVSLPSTDGRILPGMVGSVTFETESSGQAPAYDDLAPSPREIMLPSQAVLLDSDNRHFVWLAKEGKAERRFVTTGRIVAEGVIITGGLESGDKVITEGMQKVGTGTRVQLVNANGK